MTEIVDMRVAAEAVLGELRRANHEAYFAGGSVRDLVMERTPHDYDIATSARPEEVMELFPRTVAVGVAFGVVIVLHGGHEFEVATFRADGIYVDGRHPSSVRFSSAAEDVARRDFTINGLLYDPEASQVIDHVGGQADIAARVVRCIGDPRARFGEDRLRMLRAVRFVVRFNFDMEPATWEALRSQAPAIHDVSAERIRDELLKMLTGPHPDRALRLLDESGLLVEVLPEVAAMKGVDQPPEFHPEGDVFEHTALALAALEPPAPQTSGDAEAPETRRGRPRRCGWPRCCTTWESPRPGPSRIAFASTSTRRWGRASPRRSAAGCVCPPTMFSGRATWWRITCSSCTSSRCARPSGCGCCVRRTLKICWPCTAPTGSPVTAICNSTTFARRSLPTSLPSN